MSRWKELGRQVTQCQRCPRLIEHCQNVAIEKRKAYRDETYWGKPVPNLGTSRAKILIVGLAPGAHGANRTGRMFTGDRSGDWLFQTLFDTGLCSQPTSQSQNDGLRLINCAITNICRCAPPGNKPVADEVANCRPWFRQTVKLCRPAVLVALGGLAWTEIVRFAIEQEWLPNTPKPVFGHGNEVQLNTESSKSRYLLGCYHPSQQNTFTGRLTKPMLDQVFRKAYRLADLE